MEDRNTVRIRPPHGQATGDRNANVRTATAVASTAAIAVSSNMPTGGGLWITMICTAACRIRFGDSTVGAATASDHLIPANTYVQYWCHSVFETHFRVIRDSADGLLDHYVSE